MDNQLLGSQQPNVLEPDQLVAMAASKDCGCGCGGTGKCADHHHAGSSVKQVGESYICLNVDLWVLIILVIIAYKFIENKLMYALVMLFGIAAFLAYRKTTKQQEINTETQPTP